MVSLNPSTRNVFGSCLILRKIIGRNGTDPGALISKIVLYRALPTELVGQDKPISADLSFANLPPMSKPSVIGIPSGQIVRYLVKVVLRMI